MDNEKNLRLASRFESKPKLPICIPISNQDLCSFDLLVENRENLPDRIRNFINPNLHQSHLRDCTIRSIFKRLHMSICFDLDSDRDTSEQVEAAIRLCPEVLHNYPYYVGCCAVFHQKSNIKSVSFIPLLAELGIELGVFLKEERGGLLISYKCDDGHNVLQELVSIQSDDDEFSRAQIEYLLANFKVRRNNDEKFPTFLPKKKLPVSLEELLDKEYRDVLKRLWTKNLFKREDIKEYSLLHLCVGHDYFSEKRFLFLHKLDPMSLIATLESKAYRSKLQSGLPLHFSTQPKNILGFRTVFLAGFYHFPTKLGFLFHRNRQGETPFQLACSRYGNGAVCTVAKIDTSDIVGGGDCGAKTTSTKSMVISAASDEEIHLDGVYFLIRRDPIVLLLATVCSYRQYAICV